MYTFKHNSTTQVPTEVIDYRYIGAEPNNYITFNENEKWRIIGVFDGKIKIIRDEKIGDFAWDSTDVNEWPTSTLATYLNTGDYWTTVLSQEAREKIDTNIYYLGGSSTYDNLNASDYYNFERGTTVYSGRSTKWEGKVGLMYPSDYVYTFANGVDNKCFNDAYNCDASNPNASWLYKKSYVRWTIAPNSVNGSVAFFVGGSDGTVNGNYYYVDNIHGINPTVYLKSDIGLLGSGTVDDPYKIVS